MHTARRTTLAAAATMALVAAGAALAVGPWPGLARSVAAPSGQVRYSASRTQDSTIVKAVGSGDGKVLASATFQGQYGIPAVTSTGLAGGVSPDGRLLVLVEPPIYSGLRARSSFLVVSTGTMSARKIVLRGEFGFDAVAPDGRTLYLIQHASRTDLVRYVVRAYDLRAGRLLPRAIVDKREAGETMRGYAVSRATAGGGAWVYTLYHRLDAKPFIHALNAARRTAFCIDLPWAGRTETVWSARLQLADGARRLVVRSASGAVVARVDTKTLRVL
jgi:hypothetical protein